MGRPRLDPNGAKRKSKLMVYLTESDYADTQDLARLNRTSVANYVAQLIRDDAEINADRLEAFRKLSGSETRISASF